METKLTDLDSAVRAASVTREVIVAPGALASLPDVMARNADGRPLLLVTDANTDAAAGQAVETVLSDTAFNLESLVLQGEPRLKPDVEIAHHTASRLAQTGAVPVAIGAGVVNDLVKYAASLAKRPYICVATAASMDGYAASGAALLDAGFKRTFPCAPPVAVVADLNVLAAAPPNMAGWGYGDLAGKLVAGADWILADALGEEPLAPAPFAMVQDNIRTWLGDPDGVRRHDRAALRGLFEGLLISGFAMQAHGNSRPASGSDHQFAHLWEMERRTVDGLPVSHGVCVGIGCVTVLGLYEWLQGQDLTTVDPARCAARHPRWEETAEHIRAAFPQDFMADSALAETQAKTDGQARIAERLTRLKKSWPQLRKNLAARLPASSEMRDWLRRCGAPAHPSEIGISIAKLRDDVARARMIRRRYTILDLLADLGWLEAAVAETFGPNGVWAD
jgi:glycerol-1-phosphate dehydrogenase [NAD(P)+]